MATEDLIRTDVAEEIVAYLRAGTSVNVVGTRSSGRSTVLTRVTDQLTRDGLTVTRVAGVRALRDRPLSALAVAGVAMTPSPNNLHMLMSAVSDLEELMSATPSVLVIDDADDLDATTIGAIASVHARLRTPLLLTTRPGSHRQSDAAALTTELQPGVRVALPPLRFDEVHRLVHELLGGPVDLSAVARIATSSGGLPGLVRAMVDTGRTASRLAPRGGLWVARGDLWTTPLAQSVEPFLTELDESSLDALTLLAFAGTLPLEAALRSVPPDSLTRLDDAGLVRVVAEGAHAVVGVFPPLVGDYLTHEGTAMRQLLLRDRLATAKELAASAPGQAGPPRRGPGGDPLLNHHLAQHGRDRLAAARRAWESAPVPAHAVPLVEALLGAQAPPHEVDAVLACTTADADDPASLAALTVWTALYEGLTRGRLETAQEMLGRQRRELPAFDGLLRAAEGHLRVVAGTIPPPDLLADPADDEDELSRDAILVVRAEALVAAGRAQAALDTLGGFASAHPCLQQSAEVTRELALLYTCEIETAVAAALTNVERCRADLDAVGVEAHAYVAGLGLALRGRLVELDDLMSSVLALAPTPVHQSHVQTGLLSLAADAAKWQGRHAYQRSLALQSGALARRRGPHPGMAADGIVAQMHEGDDEAIADQLWELAEDRLADGFAPAGIIAGVSAIERRPDPERAARLVAAARSCDSPLCTHLAAYAVAIASGDPGQLALLEPRLLGAGLRLYAVRTAVARSLTMLTSGDVAGAVEQADAAWNQAGLRGRDLCGLFRRFDRAVSLTARERQIAVLVARGMSSQQIATAKVLSVRTVENHIFSACRKVGVDSREGLAHAAQTWLSCAIE
ncbi:MAG TPA: LuxR C-terminal-related transcriptional regulator [Cellulomonas sp.]